MARTTYTVDVPAKTPTGGNVVKRTGDTANGHYILNSGATRLMLVNTGVASATVYVWPGGHPSGHAGAVATATSTGSPVKGVTPLVQPVVLTAAGSLGDAKILGPFPQDTYGAELYFDPASGTTVNFYAFED